MRDLFLAECLRECLGLSLAESTQIANFKIDSRLVEPGDLFFALDGNRVSGADYLEAAFMKGAVGAVVGLKYRQRAPLWKKWGRVICFVEDPLEALHELAKKWHQGSFSGCLIGISGSVGKTTTKEWLLHLLSLLRPGLVEGSLNNENSKFTLPLFLLRRRSSTQIMVAEMGMSQPGDLTRLISIAPVDTALMTKVGLCHAEFFPNGIEAIYREKGKLFTSPKLRSAIFEMGFLQYPSDLDHCVGEKISFSTDNLCATLYATSEGIRERGRWIPCPDLGRIPPFLLSNVLGAVASCRALGCSWEEILPGIRTLPQVPMRFEQIEKGDVIWILDAYNASPLSMRAALRSLPKPCRPGGKRVAILAGMKELGVYSQTAHLEIGREARDCIDVLVTLGEEGLWIAQGFDRPLSTRSVFHRQEVVDVGDSLIQAGDVVLFKGSRSFQLEELGDRLMRRKTCY
jgi:UDP-N-acetylmuramoyl-tripeptide--D-alanyl-D-alanine ligase